MKTRTIELALLLLTLTGGFFAWGSGREEAKLRADYTRLIRAAGDLSDQDPTKIQVLALPTDLPMDYRWRIHLPGSTTLLVKTPNGGATTSIGANPVDFVAHVRFQEDEAGRWRCFEQFRGSSSMSTIAEPKLLAFLNGRWDRLRVEQLGVERVGTIEPQKSASLLRLVMPPEMVEEAKKVLDSNLIERHVPVVFSLSIETE